MIEKPIPFFPLSALVAGVFLALGSPSRAQESLVGLGTVFNGGAIQSATSPIGATIACTQTATGVYTITFASTGAFAGAAKSDFMVETTIDFIHPIDRAANGFVSSVTADLLTVKVHVSDLEDMGTPELAVPSSIGFAFLVRRIDVLAEGAPLASRHLVATGTVLGNGTLESAFAPGGVAVTSNRWDTGRYTVRLTKTGAFATDAGSHYVTLLSSRSIALPDVSMSGGSYNAITDDFVDFQIQAHDIQQSPTSNDAVKANASFAFAIYRMTSDDATGVPATNLLAAAAAVEGSNGSLVSGLASFPGATISSNRISQGRYRVTIEAPGAFTGADAGRFAPFVNLNEPDQFLPLDEIAKARVLVIDAGKLVVDVTVDDVQHPNDPDGIDSDGSFFLTLIDTAPGLRHDLRLSAKASGAGAKGDGIINQTGAGQSLILPLKGTKRRMVYYRSTNTGQALDDLRLRSGRIPPSLNTRILVTSFPQKNITTSVKTGTVVGNGLRPGDSVSVQASFRYRKTNKRPRSTVSLFSQSGYQPANEDANHLLIRPK